MPGCKGLGTGLPEVPGSLAVLAACSAVAWRTELIFWSSLAPGLWLLGVRVSLWAFAGCPLPSALGKTEGLARWSRGSSRLASVLTGASLPPLLTSSLRSAKSEGVRNERAENLLAWLPHPSFAAWVPLATLCPLSYF